MIPGALAERMLTDGTILAVFPLTYERARLTVGSDLWGHDRAY
jgi:hypothetical protein